MSMDEMIREKLHPNMAKLYLKRFLHNHLQVHILVYIDDSIFSYAIKDSSNKKIYEQTVRSQIPSRAKFDYYIVAR